MRDTFSASDSDTITSPQSVMPKPVSNRELIALVQELGARNKIIQSLQMSLDTTEILTIFFQKIQTIIKVGGLRFKYADQREDTKLGRDCLHHCDYRLNTNNGFVGEIIFSRTKRFSEIDLAALESLLGVLIYPLCNALRYEQAMQLALQDPLTGLGNRTALDKALHRELQLAERHQQDLTLLMIDIDHFKKINDQYGHSRGDEVLRHVAQIIQLVCRQSDLTFRYGGEEFVVLLRKTSEVGALIIAERIRREIARLKVNSDDSVFIHPTVSIGIGTREHGKKEQINDLFDRADTALYAAKANGRNRIMNSRFLV